MTTWYSQGFASGADYGGFFGPALGNIDNSPFLITWTGTDCNCYGGALWDAPPYNGPGLGPITAATMTINGISLDLDGYHNISANEWLDRGTFQDLQVATHYQQQDHPPFAIPPGGTSSYLVGTYTAGKDGYFGLGAAYLYDTNHPYQSTIFLDVYHMGPHTVPVPDIGSGLSGLIAATCVLLAFLHQRRRHAWGLV